MRCILTKNSLITVTRSCGICTRFPFNVPAAAMGKTTERTCCFLFSSLKSIAHPAEKGKKRKKKDKKNGCRCKMQRTAVGEGA